MGGGKQTSQTLEQTEQKLLDVLYSSANKLLVNPLGVPNPVTIDDLQKLVTAVAHQDFKNEYGYEYNGQATITIPAPADRALPDATEGICSFHNIDDDGVEKYVDTRILSALKLGFVRDAARADLISLGKDLFKKPSDNIWAVQKFTKDYEYQDSKDVHSCRSNSLFVWTNAQLLVNGLEVKYVIISFVGVYFKVDSPTKVVRNSLLKGVITNALSLKPVGADTSGDETQRIQAILEPYLKSKFKEHNHYDYAANNTRPPDMAAKSENWVRGNVAFCLPQSIEDKEIMNYVKENVLSAMNLPKYLLDPGPSLKLPADPDPNLKLPADPGPNLKLPADPGPNLKLPVHMDDLSTHFKTLLGENTGNSWNSIAFDKVYGSTDVGENSTRTSAIMVWNNASLTQSNTTCQQLYLFYIGVYYQIVSPTFIADAKFFSNLLTLAQKLGKDLPNTVVDPESSPLVNLKKILDEYAKSEFKEANGYQYHTAEARPNDLPQNMKAHGTSALMYFAIDSKLSDATIAEKIDATIADKIDGSILESAWHPDWFEEPFRKNLGKRLKSDLGEPKLHSWNGNSYRRQYSAHKVGVLSWNVCAIITYTNAEVIENGAKVTASLVHYLGIFYPSNEDVNTAAFSHLAASHPAVEEHDTCRVIAL